MREFAKAEFQRNKEVTDIVRPKNYKKFIHKNERLMILDSDPISGINRQNTVGTDGAIDRWIMTHSILARYDPCGRHFYMLSVHCLSLIVRFRNAVPCDIVQSAAFLPISLKSDTQVLSLI